MEDTHLDVNGIFSLFEHHIKTIDCNVATLRCLLKAQYLQYALGPGNSWMLFGGLYRHTAIQ